MSPHQRRKTEEEKLKIDAIKRGWQHFVHLFVMMHSRRTRYRFQHFRFAPPLSPPLSPSLTGSNNEMRAQEKPGLMNWFQFEPRNEPTEMSDNNLTLDDVECHSERNW